MALGLWVMAGAVIAEDKPETPEQQFKSKDTDKDGKVSLKEFIAGESKAWVANKTAYFKAIDKDGDGYLTPREFKDGIEHPPQLKKEKKKKAK
jgi:Ca2+-binding EF-hand superfamily protein